MSDKEKLESINREIEKEKDEINKIWGQIQNIPHGNSPEEIGENLLKAFLEDKPFDKLAFGLQPNKCAFIDAAFKTGDMEIVTTCFGFVEQSMSPTAFKEMIKDVPQYNKIYKMLHKNVTPSLFYGKGFYTSQNVPKLQEMADQEENKFVKTVIEDHIKRLSGKTIEFGFEDVDTKWKNLKDSCLRHQYTIRPDQLMSKTGLFSTKWKTAVDPYQAARMTLHWRAPQPYVDGFVKEIKDPKEKAWFDENQYIM